MSVDSGIGSNPFDPMPNIEHHQRVRKKRIMKERRGGSLLSTTKQVNARAHESAMLSTLGKRLVREDEEVEAKRAGRKRLFANSKVSSSSAEVDKGQPRVSNELFKLELLGAWEPAGSLYTSTPNI